MFYYALVTLPKNRSASSSRPILKREQVKFHSWSSPSSLINIQINVNLEEMCGDAPRRHLSAAWALPACLPGGAQAPPGPILAASYI